MFFGCNNKILLYEVYDIVKDYRFCNLVSLISMLLNKTRETS